MRQSTYRLVLTTFRIRQTAVQTRRTMKLMTHNMLSSAFLKDVVDGFPLRLDVQPPREEKTTLKLVETEFNADFVKRLMAKLDYGALRGAVQQLPVDDEVKQLLPETAPDGEFDDDFLRRVHRVALEIDVLEGALVCPESGRAFPISKGIPNMLATTEELK